MGIIKKIVLMVPPLKKIRNNLVQLREEKQQLQEAIAQRENENGQLREEKQQLQEAIAQRENENGQLREEKQQLQEAIAQRENENGQLREEKQQLQEAIAQRENENGQLREEKQQLQEAIAQRENENGQLREEKQQLQEAIAQRENENGQLREEKMNLMLRDTIKPELKTFLTSTNDPVRYGALYLAIKDIYENNIVGSFAELGVWQGYTSKIINKFAPDRKLYLFDTFEGFDQRDLSESLFDSTEIKEWFKNTSEEDVLKNFENFENIVIKKGFFPDTTIDMNPNEKYAFVMIDFDLYKPVREALDYFYDKVVDGGYIFVHDYNLPVFDWGAKKAVNEFISDKNIKFVQLPDAYGSVVIKK